MASDIVTRRPTNRLKIIYALMMKDALGKHGHHTLGFFWMLGEPMFLLVGIMVLWSVAHVTHGSEVEVIPFALSAYTYLTLWRHIAGGSVRLINRSRWILYFRSMSLLDIFLAKAVLETVSIFAVFTVLYIPFYLLHVCPMLNDPLLLVGGFFFTGWFAFGFGLILASLTEWSEVVVNLVGAIMYITLPVTGAFTMQEWLPSSVRDALAWSPLVNCVEMIRGGLFSPTAITVHFDFAYLLSCCVVLTGVGIVARHYAEKHGEA